MSTSNSLPIQEISESLKDKYKKLSNSEAGCEQLLRLLAQFKNNTREYIQNQTKAVILGAIKKLETKQPLSSDELKVVKIWIVGDAESYKESQKDAAQWESKANDLIGEIDQCRSREGSAEIAFRLWGLLTDLDQETRDMIVFFRNTERVSRFEEASKSIDADEAKSLVEILKRKMHSFEE